MTPTSPPGATPPGPLATAWLVARKELVEALRDRHTLIQSVVVPLALYPVLFWVMLQAFLVIRARDERTTVTVAVAGAPADLTAERLDAALRGATAEEGGAGARSEAPLVVQRVDATLAEAGLEALLVDPATGKPKGGEVDAVLAFGPPGADGEARTPELFSISTRSRSRLAADRVESRLEALGRTLREEGVRASERDPSALEPFRLERHDLAGAKDKGGLLLSLILPMTIVVMAVLGALVPAVDLTAGEKERKTAETTLLVPVPRLGVRLGKILTVAIAAGFATLLNLLGMGLAAKHLLAQFPGGGVTIQIPWINFLYAAPLLVLFVVMVSALLVALASFAETFKQGQSLIGSVQMLFIGPAFVAILPNVHLTPGLALVPIVQTTLGVKTLLAPDGLAGQGKLAALALAFLFQLLWTAAAVYFCLRLSGREDLRGKGALLKRVRRSLASGGRPE